MQYFSGKYYFGRFWGLAIAHMVTEVKILLVPGIFYAINELSGVILVLFGSVLFYTKIAFSNMKYYLVLLFLLFCVAMFSTKTAMGGMLLLFVFLQSICLGRKNILYGSSSFFVYINTSSIIYRIRYGTRKRIMG